MRLLADESVHAVVVRRLRNAGHDVRAISEERPGTVDEDVAALAVADQRVLLTEDRDFRRIIHLRLALPVSVVYMRYAARSRQRMAQAVVNLIRDEGEQLRGRFVVIQPGRTRISRLPDN